jgi:hypothetical protein
MRGRFVYATFFLAVALAVFSRGLQSGSVSLWLCNLMPWVLFIGFLIGNLDLIKAGISLGLIPQSIFSIGALLHIFLGTPVPQIMSEVLNGEHIDLAITLAVHMLTASVALFATYKQKTNKAVLAYSAFLVLAVYGLSLMSPENVNFVRSFDIMIEPYTVLWPVFVFILLVIPVHIMQISLYYWSRRQSQALRGIPSGHPPPSLSPRVCLLP